MKIITLKIKFEKWYQICCKIKIFQLIYVNYLPHVSNLENT